MQNVKRLQMQNVKRLQMQNVKRLQMQNVKRVQMQNEKESSTSQMHFGFFNIRSKMHNSKDIAISNEKFRKKLP